MANDVCKSLGSGKLPGEGHATSPTKATSEKWWISMNYIRIFLKNKMQTSVASDSVQQQNSIF